MGGLCHGLAMHQDSLDGDVAFGDVEGVVCPLVASSFSPNQLHKCHDMWFDEASSLMMQLLNQTQQPLQQPGPNKLQMQQLGSNLHCLELLPDAW